MHAFGFPLASFQPIWTYQLMIIGLRCHPIQLSLYLLLSIINFLSDTQTQHKFQQNAIISSSVHSYRKFHYLLHG
jgi:hypothetical protein